MTAASQVHSILTINGGSSSIKVAVCSAGDSLERRLSGAFDRIGPSGANLTCIDSTGNRQEDGSLAASDH